MTTTGSIPFLICSLEYVYDLMRNFPRDVGMRHSATNLVECAAEGCWLLSTPPAVSTCTSSDPDPGSDSVPDPESEDVGPVLTEAALGGLFLHDLFLEEAAALVGIP
jgi:hypothetical protein